MFLSEKRSASATAQWAVHDLECDWSAVSGMDYWGYKGVKLSQLGAAPVAELADEAEQPSEAAQILQGSRSAASGLLWSAGAGRRCTIFLARLTASRGSNLCQTGDVLF